MYTHLLTPDTQTAFLLCAALGESINDVNPLSPTEFDWIVAWLKEKGLGPSTLIGPDGDKLVDDIEHRKLNPTRLRDLLNRGGSLAIALESITNNGLWVLSRFDEKYPKRLNDRLKHLAPPLLYGAGNQDLLSTGGLAIVGSRDIDEAGTEFTTKAAAICARDDITVNSGAARGVDQIAMQSALNEGGKAVGVLAADLARVAVSGSTREWVMNDQLTLVSPYNPNAGFSVGNAMGRNKYIYALSDWALVVSSDLNKGGTWSGAIDNLKRDYGVPLFVRQESDIPPGNEALIEKGGIPIAMESLELDTPFIEWLKEKAELSKEKAEIMIEDGKIEGDKSDGVQISLFGENDLV